MRRSVPARVDESVELAEGGDRIAHQPARRRGIAEIGAERDGAVAGLVCRRFGDLARAEIMEADGGAGFSEAEPDRAAHADRARAGDQCRAAGQGFRHVGRFLMRYGA